MFRTELDVLGDAKAGERLLAACYDPLPGGERVVCPGPISEPPGPRAGASASRCHLPGGRPPASSRPPAPRAGPSNRRNLVINAKKAAYGIAAAAMGGGLIIPAVSASAATQYHDTSVQVGTFSSHAITGTADARNGAGVVKVSGSNAVPFEGVGGTTTPLVFTLKSGAIIDGVRLSLSTDGSAVVGGNTTISASGTPTSTGASEDGTVVLDATDSDGDVAVVTVPVVVGANTVQVQKSGATNGGGAKYTTGLGGGAART